MTPLPPANKTRIFPIASTEVLFYLTKQKPGITKHTTSERPGRAVSNLAALRDQKGIATKDSTSGQDSLLERQQLLRTCLEKTNAPFPSTSGLQ